MANRHGKQGFTLIEAAVAIAVVAILSGIIVPLVVKNLNDARVARARNDVQVIAAAIASQLKDTGTRPVAAGPGGAAGAAVLPWISGPAGVVGVPAGIVGATTGNRFINLFTLAPAGALQTMFGYPAATLATAEFAYKGPYLANNVATNMDPFGGRYVILGYNGVDQALPNSPIWVVCAGPDHAVLPANALHGAAGYPLIWNVSATGGVSQDDIVVRVN